MVIIKGIGWIAQDRYGCIKKKLNQEYDSKKNPHSVFLQAGIFRYPVNNFGRFDAPSKLICALAGLALFDAGISYHLGKKKRDAGLIGTSKSGSWAANMKYFRDYIDSGRKLARGNLFIYTLPSSPLAEASIHFGLQGPLFYMLRPANPLGALIKCASDLIARRQAQIMLAVAVEENEGICFVLTQDKIKSQEYQGLSVEILNKLSKIVSLKKAINIFKDEN